MADEVLYVVAMDHCVKIGVTNNPERRVRQLRNGGTGARIIRLWDHEHPRAIEMMCRDAWHMKREHCFETFEASPRAAVMLVNRMIRAFENGDRPGTRGQP